MLEGQFRGLRFLIIKLSRWLWKTQAIWLRGSLCLALGIGALYLDQRGRFDQRFTMRGPQPIDSSLIIIDIRSSDWESFNKSDRNLLRAMKEYASINERFFWNPESLEILLKKILTGGPKAIGVTFFFPMVDDLSGSSKVFEDERIIWAARLDSDDRALLPITASNYGYNVGILNYSEDEDGIYRRFTQPVSEIPHFVVRLSQVSSSDQPSQNYIVPGESRAINYRGTSSTYPTYTLANLLNGELDQILKDKVVIVGSRDLSSQLIDTPLGPMAAAEVLANSIDSFLHNRWISEPPNSVNILYLAFILCIGIWLLFSYPQSAALIFLFWLGTGLTALSLWIFDTFYIWIPILPPLAMLSFTYILFLGYQLTQKENVNWRLQQEKKYLYEVEQLKHNFVSLISHDLKTPIAKIQAICDRLMTQNKGNETEEGLLALRKESSELHRYIQSILRVSRIESKDFRLNKDAADINEIAAAVIEQVTPLAKEKHLEIHKNLEPIFSIEIDSILIHEVILNLVENAVKYTPENGRIEVRSQEVDDEVIFWVKDTGNGIDENEQQKVFQKFFRGKDHELQTKGSGIGLYLVKYFIELHGGKVFLESKKGFGTKIGFRLPISDEKSLGATGHIGVGV